MNLYSVDDILAWKQGYKYALHHSVDIKQLLELEELLITIQENSDWHVNHALESGSSMLVSGEGHAINENSFQTSDNHEKLSTQSGLYSDPRDTSDISSKHIDNSDLCTSNKARGKE